MPFREKDNNTVWRHESGQSRKLIEKSLASDTQMTIPSAYLLVIVVLLCYGGIVYQHGGEPAIVSLH